MMPHGEKKKKDFFRLFFTYLSQNVEIQDNKWLQK